MAGGTGEMEGGERSTVSLDEARTTEATLVRADACLSRLPEASEGDPPSDSSFKQKLRAAEGWPLASCEPHAHGRRFALRGATGDIVGSSNKEFPVRPHPQHNQELLECTDPRGALEADGSTELQERVAIRKALSMRSRMRRGIALRKRGSLGTEPSASSTSCCPLSMSESESHSQSHMRRSESQSSDSSRRSAALRGTQSERLGVLAPTPLHALVRTQTQSEGAECDQSTPEEALNWLRTRKAASLTHRAAAVREERTAVKEAQSRDELTRMGSNGSTPFTRVDGEGSGAASLTPPHEALPASSIPPPDCLASRGSFSRPHDKQQVSEIVRDEGESDVNVALRSEDASGLLVTQEKASSEAAAMTSALALVNLGCFVYRAGCTGGIPRFLEPQSSADDGAVGSVRADPDAKCQLGVPGVVEEQDARQGVAIRGETPAAPEMGTSVLPLAHMQCPTEPPPGAPEASSPFAAQSWAHLRQPQEQAQGYAQGAPQAPQEPPQGRTPEDALMPVLDPGPKADGDISDVDSMDMCTADGDLGSGDWRAEELLELGLYEAGGVPSGSHGGKGSTILSTTQSLESQEITQGLRQQSTGGNSRAEVVSAAQPQPRVPSGTGGLSPALQPEDDVGTDVIADITCELGISLASASLASASLASASLASSSLASASLASASLASASLASTCPNEASEGPSWKSKEQEQSEDVRHRRGARGLSSFYGRTESSRLGAEGRMGSVELPPAVCVESGAAPFRSVELPPSWPSWADLDDPGCSPIGSCAEEVSAVATEQQRGMGHRHCSSSGCSSSSSIRSTFQATSAFSNSSSGTSPSPSSSSPSHPALDTDFAATSVGSLEPGRVPGGVSGGSLGPSGSMEALRGGGLNPVELLREEMGKAELGGADLKGPLGPTGVSKGDPAGVLAVAELLRHLSRKSEPWRRHIAASGGVPLLTRLLQWGHRPWAGKAEGRAGDPSMRTEMQEVAVCILRNVALEPSTRMVFRTEGAVGPVVRVLAEGTPGAKEHAAAVLFCLAKDDMLKRDIARTGAVRHLAQLYLSNLPLGHHHSALSSSSTSSSSSSFSFCLNPLAAPPRPLPPASATLAVRALYYLSLFRPCKAAIVADGVVPALVRVLRTTPLHLPPAEDAVLLLHSLMAHHHAQLQCAEALGIPCLARAVEEGSALCAEYAISALLRFAHTNALLLKVVSGDGIVPCLLDIVGSPGVKERTRLMVRILCAAQGLRAGELLVTLRSVIALETTGCHVLAHVHSKLRSNCRRRVLHPSFA